MFFSIESEILLRNPNICRGFGGLRRSKISFGSPIWSKWGQFYATIKFHRISCLQSNAKLRPPGGARLRAKSRSYGAWMPWVRRTMSVTTEKVLPPMVPTPKELEVLRGIMYIGRPTLSAIEQPILTFFWCCW